MVEKYTCEWYNEEKTIVLVRSIDPNWTWEDATNAVKEQVTLSETVAHPVHAIFHFEQRPNVPVSGAIQNLQKLMNYRAKNEDLGIFVNINQMLMTLLNTVGRIYKLREFVSKYRFVSTMEEAFEEIEKYESKRRKDKVS
jgi:hypothetical protein